MELIATTADIWIIWIPVMIAFVVGLVIGVLVYIGDGKYDITPVFGVPIGMAIFSGLFALMFYSGNVSDVYDDKVSAFETFYGVTVTDGTIPDGPNSVQAVTMFTQDGGPKACLVTTDAVRYTVECDGQTLAPVK